jgi:hypothetical protein
MAKKKSTKPMLQATANAKVEVVAKATYQRKRITTEIIPPDVTRAKTSAWLDLVSPLTEWAGLRGDELKLRRAQLRLQREDVLAEIARRARIGLKKSTAELKPIQNKFLVPFLEKASLEDEKSSLMDMWAGLLVSAAQGGSSQHIHFVSIISQLSQKQGELFVKLVHTKSEHLLELAMDNIKSLEFHAIRETVAGDLDHILNSNATDFDALASAIAGRMDCIGIEVVYGDVGIGSAENYVQISFVNDEVYSDEVEVDFSILEAVGLIRRAEVRFTLREIYSISLVYYHLTSMGFYFAKACGLIGDLGDVSSVAFEESVMLVTFDDGRTIRVPLEGFPKLLCASSLEREDFRITGVSVEWKKLEEEIRIESLLKIAQGEQQAHMSD